MARRYIPGVLVDATKCDYCGRVIRSIESCPPADDDTLHCSTQCQIADAIETQAIERESAIRDVRYAWSH